MAYGMYLSAEGAQAQAKRLEVISNNLANVNTVGFKPDTEAALGDGFDPDFGAGFGPDLGADLSPDLSCGAGAADRLDVFVSGLPDRSVEDACFAEDFAAVAPAGRWSSRRERLDWGDGDRSGFRGPASPVFFGLGMRAA